MSYEKLTMLAKEIARLNARDPIDEGSDGYQEVDNVEAWPSEEAVLAALRILDDGMKESFDHESLRARWYCRCGTLQYAESGVCDTCADTYPGFPIVTVVVERMVTRGLWPAHATKELLDAMVEGGRNG